MFRLSKEEVNLIRLINRLDKVTKKINKETVEVNEQDEKQNQITKNKYWELKSLETTVNFARSIIDANLRDADEFNHKLDLIHGRVQRALQVCHPPPAPASPFPFIANVREPEAPAPIEIHQEGEKISKPAERKAEKIDRGGHANVAVNLNETQEELTKELQEMSHQLRKNVANFNELLGKDEVLLKENLRKLESNSSVIGTQGGQLSRVQRSSRRFTWATLASIVVVTLAWFIMFIIIKLT